MFLKCYNNIIIYIINILLYYYIYYLLFVKCFVNKSIKAKNTKKFCHKIKLTLQKILNIKNYINLKMYTICTRYHFLINTKIFLLFTYGK